MSLKHGLLGLLNYGSMTGYELDKSFKDSLGFFWQANTSQIYRELDAMERAQWLISKRIIQNEKPNKRVYSITDKGKSELASWLAAPKAAIAEAMCTKSALLMRVFFAGEADAEQAVKMLRAYREQCIQHIQKMSDVSDIIPQYEESVADPQKTQYWKIAALYGESYYHAGLEWANKAIAILEAKS